MTRYLMNAAVIPHGCVGTFTYRLATVEELATFLRGGPVVNTNAYQETLDWVARSPATPSRSAAMSTPCSPAMRPS